MRMALAEQQQRLQGLATAGAWLSAQPDAVRPPPPTSRPAQQPMQPIVLHLPKAPLTSSAADDSADVAMAQDQSLPGHTQQVGHVSVTLQFAILYKATSPNYDREHRLA